MPELREFSNPVRPTLILAGLWASLREFARAPQGTYAFTVRRRLLLAAKILVTVGAFWLVLSLANIGEAMALMQAQDVSLVALAGLAILGQIILGALRWRAVLGASAQQDAANISLWLALRLYYASIFFNSILPGTFGGDVVRAISTRALGVSTGASVQSVVLDRLLALVVLLVMALPALPLIWSGIGISGTVLAVGFGALVLTLVLYLVLGRIAALAPAKVQADRVIQSFWRALLNLLSHPRPLLQAVPLTFLAHAAYCLAAFFLARSLGVQLEIFDALTLMPLVLLVSALPISIGGWGVREIGAIGLLGLVGISSHEAVLISLQFGVISVLLSLPGGLLWLGMRSAGRSVSAGDS